MIKRILVSTALFLGLTAADYFVNLEDFKEDTFDQKIDHIGQTQG